MIVYVCVLLGGGCGDGGGEGSGGGDDNISCDRCVFVIYLCGREYRPVDKILHHF